MSRYCESRPAVRPSDGLSAPRSSPCFVASPRTPHPSSSRSTTFSGSTRRPRRRSSSRSGGSRARRCWASSPCARRSVDQSLIASAARDGTLELLELGPLSVAALHRIVTDSLGRSFPRPTLVRIAQTSGGNPLLRPRDRASSRPGRGEPRRGRSSSAGQPASLMAGRIGVLPSKTREALLRTSALARPDLRLVDAQALAAAEEAALVRIRDDDRVEFVHPLYASAVYSSASLERRRAAHRALAEAVDGSGGAGSPPRARQRWPRRAGGA